MTLNCLQRVILFRIQALMTFSCWSPVKQQFIHSLKTMSRIIRRSSFVAKTKWARRIRQEHFDSFVNELFFHFRFRISLDMFAVWPRMCYASGPTVFFALHKWLISISSKQNCLCYSNSQIYIRVMPEDRKWRHFRADEDRVSATSAAANFSRHNVICFSETFRFKCLVFHFVRQ